MPYIIKKVKNGFKVCKEDDKSECFSKKPLSAVKAKKQKTAIILSELKKEGKGKSNVDDYIIAIPSYDRVETLKNNTISLLEKNNIDKNKIIIFVANKDEEKKYKNEFNDYKIIVGVKGLLPQRNFMTKYFKEGQNIIYMDDDIEEVKIKKSKSKENKTLHNLNLKEFFPYSFEELKKNNFHIWGINPVFNPYFLYNKISTDLRYIAGGFYGVINRHDKDLMLKYESDKEDMERTLRFYHKDKGLLRFNNVVIKTKNYHPGGLQSEYLTKENRIKDGKKRVERLLKEFPNYGSIKQRPSGIYEFVFKRNPSLVGGAIDFNNDNQDDTEIEYNNIKFTPEIRKLREDLLLELERITVPRIERIRKKGKWYFRSRGEILGVGENRTMNFGCGLLRFSGKGEFKNNKKYPEAFRLLNDYGKALSPKGFEFNVITLNKNMTAKKHKDSSNTGFSYITALGDFTGGGLYVYKPNGKDPKLYDDLKNKILIFNGAILPHKSEKFEGTRYSIIYYKSSDCKFKLPKKGSGKPADPELYQEVKEEVYQEQPKHSLFRSARIQKEYQERGGKYLGSKSEGIPKWFNEKWISLNDYVRGEILKCGSSDTEKKYGEYPLCRPLEIAKKLGKENIQKMIKEKDKLGEKTLKTEDVLGTKKFNVGRGKTTKFQSELKKIGFPPNAYLMIARRQAKKYGLDPTLLNFCSDPDKKLNYDGTPFGASGYNDYIIWTFLEKSGKQPSGTAKEKRRLYRARAENIKGDWVKDKTSPNNLAINILW